MSPSAKPCEATPAVFNSEFEPVLARLASKVAGRYHTGSKRIEDQYLLSDTILGAGSNGDVRLAKSLSDDSSAFAVKTIRFDSIAGIDEWTMLENQLEVALLVDHSQLIGVIDVYETEEAVHFVMPCMEGGALGDEVAQMSDHDKKQTARQMLLALEYLHGHGIVHRDVKPANYVTEQSNEIHLKMIDFDLCTFWQPGDPKLHDSCGTPGFMSPELLSGNGCTSQTDMWSLGVSLFKLFVGEMPFAIQEAPDQEAVDKLLASHVTAGLNADARNLLSGLLRVDAAERPSAEQALRHSFVVLREPCQEVAVPSRARAVVHAPQGGLRRRSGARRQMGRPTRCGRACGRSTRNTHCTGRISTQNDLDTLPRTHEAHLLLPVVPLQQKIARVRWTDLEDEDDVPE